MAGVSCKGATERQEMSSHSVNFIAIAFGTTKVIVSRKKCEPTMVDQYQCW